MALPGGAAGTRRGAGGEAGVSGGYLEASRPGTGGELKGSWGDMEGSQRGAVPTLNMDPGERSYSPTQ